MLEGAGLAEAGLATGLVTALAAGLAAGLASTLAVFAAGLLVSGSSRESILRRDDVRLDAGLLLSDELLLFSFTILL